MTWRCWLVLVLGALVCLPPSRAQAPSLVLADGGLQFPDSTVQETASLPEHKRIVVVSPVGTPVENGVNLLNVISGIAPSAGEPSLLKVEPGVYDVGWNQLKTKPFLEIEGSGQTVTRIKGNYEAAGAERGLVQVVSNSELRMLTVENYGGGTWDYMGIHVREINVRISDVTVLVHSGIGSSVHTGIEIAGSGTVVRNATVLVTGGGFTVGLNLDAGDILVDGAFVRAIDGSNRNSAVISADEAQARTIKNSIFEASGAASDANTGIFNGAFSELDIFNSVIRALGATNNYAIHNYQGQPGFGGGEIEIHNSRVSGEDLSVFNASLDSVYVGASQLKGPVSNTGSGSIKCGGAYDEDYDSLSASCGP